MVLSKLVVLTALVGVCIAKESSFGVVIDAGSTGSRIHVFSWPKREYESFPTKISDPIARGAVKDADDPVTTASGRDELDGLLSYAKSEVKKAGGTVSETPIFLKATGGMRILTEATRNAVMDAIRSKLSKSGFLWRSDAQARVISGEEEGVYGWISANYQKDLLQMDKPYQLTDTIGALDLGGASTQITFKPKDFDILANSYNLQLGTQVQENLYTHSFLYYGNVQSIRRIHQVVLYTETKANASSGRVLPVGKSVDNPCLLSGYSMSYQDALSKNNVTFNGAGNFDSCVEMAKVLMDKDAVCLTDAAPPGGGMGAERMAQRDAELVGLSKLSSDPYISKGNRTCSIGGVYQPALQDSKLLAFSTFSYVWAFFELDYKNGKLSDLETAGKAFCGLTWKQAKKDHNGVPHQYLSDYCIQASFIYTLLVHGYGLDPTKKNLQVAPPSEDYGWALGSIIFDANSGQFDILNDSNSLMPLTIGFGITAAALLVLGCTCMFLLGREWGYIGSKPTSSRNPLVSSWGEDSDGDV